MDEISLRLITKAASLRREFQASVKKFTEDCIEDNIEVGEAIDTAIIELLGGSIMMSIQTAVTKDDFLKTCEKAWGIMNTATEAFQNTSKTPTVNDILEAVKKIVDAANDSPKGPDMSFPSDRKLH